MADRFAAREHSMHALVLVAALVAAPKSVVCSSSTAAAERIALSAQTGTLIFSRGDCLAVRAVTRSSYTHVAAVVVEDGKCYVYDSMNGIGVRRLTLAAYCRSESASTLCVYHPRSRFTQTRAECFTEHLKSEMGREYDVVHHVTGKRSDGVHCAEYVTDALCACRLLRAERPPKVTPASLRNGVIESKLYTAALTVDVRKPRPKPPEDAGCCEKFWFDTKQCTVRFFSQVKGWCGCK
jgi:hypothetical protein